ncbi:MAG TPA: hypothetical protein VGA31_05810 [Thermoanaerobaculia bacterium]
MKRIDVLYASRNAQHIPVKALFLLGAIALSLLLGSDRVTAEQPPAPCHANPLAAQDEATVASRGDIASLPLDLKNLLVRIGGRPHTYLPMQVYAEADSPSQFFQYYLLDTHGFEPNVFTTRIPGVNDTAMLTATGSNCGLPTIGAIRVVLEPKPGLPTDPGDVRAFIDMFTDISGLFVINNESGWYEGWMIHDVVVPTVARPRPDGHAQFGTITAADAAQLRAMGAGNNVPGNIFTVDGLAVHFPSDTDHFPDRQSNVVPVQLSLGAYNAMQQTDVHSYWEFNYTTNWVHPLYELPFTGGGFPNLGGGSDSLCPSIVPGSGPEGKKNKASVYGDNPNRPRDPDLFDAEIDSQREFRQRFIPSGLANEVFLDVYARPVSFEPGMKNLTQRLFKAYTAEVARVDQNGDGVISAAEGDVDEGSDGFADNTRLFIPATAFNRVAITREINDSLLAPRFAPSQRGWVLTGFQVRVSPSVPASEGRDGDDR